MGFKNYELERNSSAAERTFYQNNEDEGRRNIIFRDPKLGVIQTQQQLELEGVKDVQGKCNALQIPSPERRGETHGTLLVDLGG